MNSTKLSNFIFLDGQHCETTATGSLLRHIGIDLTEPMLFGLGEGLGFIFWNMKMMSFPFIGGRVKPDVLTQNICRNLNLTLNIQETSSVKKAWKNVSDLIDSGTPVGLKLDCFHLDYFTVKVHFAGHYVVMYGYDEDHAYLVDTKQQGGKVKTTLENLALARSEKGSMSSRNLSYAITKDRKSPEKSDIINTAIHNNAQDYLNPPITNFGFKGILKTSAEIKKWFDTSKDPKGDFQTTAMLMERAGTGGALFRNLYRDFLLEAYNLTSRSEFKDASKSFVKIASLWTKVADLFAKAGESMDKKHIDDASILLVELSKLEKNAMEDLLAATQRS